jgi:hypothetical protein
MIIRGKQYKLRFVSNLKGLGECSSPSEPNRVIKIKKGLDTKTRFEIILHEIIHAACWDLAEETVEEMATDATTILFNEFTIEEKK